MGYWTIRALTLGRASRTPSGTYPSGRKCRTCGVPLSVYNSTSYCACHEGHNRHFSVDELLTTRWPTYLPDPAVEKWRYGPDELQLLAVLSHHQGEWVHLSYVLIEGNHRVIDNAIRKLRRKGFTIVGRKHNLCGGGYKLVDRIPPISGGDDGGVDLRRTR